MGFEGDLVAEAFELADEPVLVALGVFGLAAVKVVVAEVAKGDAAGCPAPRFRVDSF